MHDHAAIPAPVKTAPAAEITPAIEVRKDESLQEGLQPFSLQCKLQVGAPDDPLEREADTMADQVMRMPENAFVQRKCDHCEEEQVSRKPLDAFIQRKADGASEASHTVTQQIQSSRGGGSPMPGSTKSFMESRFATDFSGVRIHTGNEAVQLSRELNAQAFTVGSDVYFNSGKFSPGTSDGKRLLAHELTHVVQQNPSIQGKLIQPKLEPASQTTNNYNPGTDLTHPGSAVQTDESVKEKSGTETSKIQSKLTGDPPEDPLDRVIHSGELSARDNTGKNFLQLKRAEGAGGMAPASPGTDQNVHLPGKQDVPRTDNILLMPDPRVTFTGTEIISRKCSSCEQEDHLQKKEEISQEDVPAGKLRKMPTPGSAEPPGANEPPPGFHHDFSAIASYLPHTIQRSSIGIRPYSTFNYSLSRAAIPSIQRFGLSDIRQGISEGADFISDTSSAAADWAGERVGEVVELGAEAFMAIIRQVAPQLAGIIQNGPGSLINTALSEGIQGWFSRLFGNFNLGEIVGELRTSISDAFSLIEGVLRGDAQACETFNEIIDAIRGFIGSFMDNPVFQAVSEAFNSVRSFFSEAVNFIMAPIFDAVMELAGDAFAGVRAVATTISDWMTSVRNALSAAWDWVMEQLGITGSGEGGIWEWIKGFATEIWNEIKQTLAPVMGPLTTIVNTLLLLSPAGPVIIAVRYGPRVVSAIQWLWANRSNPNIVRDAREQLGDSVLPELLESGEAFINQVNGAITQLVGQLTSLGAGVMELIGSISGIPLLQMARDFAQSVSETVQGFITWAQETLMGAVASIREAFTRIAAVVEPYMEILSSIGMAILVPSMIPVILAGWAWRALPDCYKPPIIDFLLDGIIGYLQRLPNLPFMGPLWSLLKPFIIGFLRGFRERDDQQKIAVTNKLAKIISGASLRFIAGFLVGLLRGLWEGLTDPFILIYQILSGLYNLQNWFMGLIMPAAAPAGAATGAPSGGSPGAAPGAAPVAPPGERTSPAPEQAGATAAAPQQTQASQAALTTRMQEMGAELVPPVNEVTGNFMPGLQEYFTSGEGITYEDVVNRLGTMWASAEEAIEGAGGSLAETMVNAMLNDEAEYDMGNNLGWLTGTIAFELVLGYFTAGTYQAASALGRVLQQFARILDWTGEVMGHAFRALARVGEYLTTLFRRLLDMVQNATGPLRAVLNAMQDIADKVIRFGEELLGRLGRGAASETTEAVAERTAREAAEAASERTAREAAEAGTERTTRETADEVAEEAGEQGTRDADESLKAAQLPLAMAEARATSELNDRINTPVLALMGILNTTIKPRYRWIDRFGFETKGPERYEVFFTASPKHVIDEIYDTTRATLEGRAADPSTVERRLNETDAQYRERLENLALDDTPMVRPDGTTETADQVQERMREAQRRHEIIDERVRGSEANLDNPAARVDEHAAATDRLWTTGSGKPETIMVPGGRTIELRNPADMTPDDLRVAREVLESRSPLNSRTRQQLNEIGLEMEKRNASEHVRQAREAFERRGGDDRDVFHRALNGEEHIWTESREQAQRVVNTLEEAGGGVPRGVHGPEVHVGGEAGPREIHINFRGTIDGNFIKPHIYFPGP